MGKLKVFTAFSGYDSQCMALDRIGIDYDLVGWSEIDRYAIQAHNLIYPQWAGRNYGDISKIDFGGVEDFGRYGELLYYDDYGDEKVGNAVPLVFTVN
jgi:site-specific DNA-cytosine methylase